MLAVILTFSLTACGNLSEEAASQTPSASSDKFSSAVITHFTGYGEQADTLMSTLKDSFWMLRTDKMVSQIGDKDPVTLWGYAAYMESAGLWYELHPEDAEIRAEYLKALQGVENYRTTWRTDGLQVYQCWAGEGKAECFYDDDVWVVLEFLHAYALLGDAHWLDQAKGTADFCYSGWDEKVGGGVYWKEDDKASKNTCINAPLALASCELYQATGEQIYLDWAIRLYDWTKEKLLDPEDNTFWDNIGINGNVDKNKYTYNTGNMIGAAAALYEITGEAGYLSDAMAYAEGAYNRFGKLTEVDKADEPVYICDSNSWFGGSLLKGYLKLAEVYADTDPKYVDSYAQCLAYCCLISNDNRGYILSGWVESGISHKPDLLNQAGNARLLLLLQLWRNAGN